ncbi:MAG: Ig-like domain-containing protein [Chromatiales bacterium]
MPHRRRIFVLTVVALIGLCFGPTRAAAQTDVIGQWSPPPHVILPYFPVHTHMLPTGKVMIWPGDGGVSGNNPRSWDPANESVSSLSAPGFDLFCSGHSFLADGTLFVAGGHISNNVGLSRASKYNPFTNAWSSPPLPNMNAGRWYPTTTVLANGDVLVVSGDIDTTVGVNTLPQVFQVPTGTWRSLTNAQLQQELYPQMLLAPNGKVFNAGPTKTTRYLDPSANSGTGAWSDVATRVGVTRSYGSAVMYAPGKVLVMGGGSNPPKKTAEVIDLNAASPSWRAVGSMQYARRQINATLLPDGKVLVTGGTSGPGFNDMSPSTSVYAAELWDPATETWSTMASASIPRLYHSAALLLPDGRVLSTGGNDHAETETYSPPYLFKGARPTITSAPSSVAYGQSFFVGTPDAATISKITMLRLSSVTHAFNMSQYISNPSFAQTTGGLNVTAPPTGNVAPPGYYLLFILNGSGVPSLAKYVQLGGTAAPDTTPPTVSITTPASGATVSGTAVTVSATASDNVGVAGVQFKLGSANLGAEDTTSPYSVTWNSTTATNGSYTLTAVARDAAGNVATSAGVTVTVNNASSLPDVIVTSLSYASGVFTSTVKNQGTAATPSAIYIGVGYFVDGVQRTWGSKLGPLAAGASVTIGTNGGAYTIPNGTHTIMAHVDDVNRFAESDETNNQFSQSITVGGTPDTTLPTVSMTAPANGTTVSGSSVTVSANASDNIGVSGVQFKLGSANLGAEDTTSPYSVTWNSTTATNGSYTLTAVARDAAGNVATSAGVTVTVNNASSLPDVIVTSLSYASGVFTSTVKNQGTAATPSAIYIGVGYFVDGVQRTWGSKLGPLAAGASVTIGTNGGAYTIPNGTHTIMAHVDDVNRFAESDETNNQFSQSITVP